MNARSVLPRLVTNIAAYLALGLAVFALAARTAGRPVSSVVLIGLLASLWSAVVTSALELVFYPRMERRRVIAGAIGGALSLGGFALALAWFLDGSPFRPLVLVAAGLGGAMQGARAFSWRPSPLLTDDGDVEA